MSKAFTEIVMEGPFMLVKGFLMGFLAMRKAQSNYFFHRKSGIRRETLKDLLKELFEMDNHVHFCLETELVSDFKTAAALYQEKTGLEIKSERAIRGASFSFAYEFHNKAMAEEAGQWFNQLPAGVKLADYQPFEHQAVEGHGIEGYAPLFEFTSRAKGRIEGEFEPVIDLYLTIKRSRLSEAVICSEVDLAF
jgi:hypothetical protein